MGVPATSWAWSTCSRRSLPETATIPMISSSRPSWLTIRAGRSTSRCSSTLSPPGDKMNKTEIDDIFNEFDIDEDFMVKTKEVVGLFVAVKEEEKKVEEKPA